ncbi:hypothetical protein JTE90_025449 [Oedothorax gibbosus]|uniref:Uncharacterized protein n=1 Tax=Oedothorax gibbosus TaxID=931172 RepID=A0AAV6U9S3_9ARAC|nr:hypothetical protein JTE90_025449 [Oedothorax gibbosus]
MGSLNFLFLLLLLLINTKRPVSSDCLYNIIYDKFFKPEITAVQLAPRNPKIYSPITAKNGIDDFTPKECTEESKFEPSKRNIPVEIVENTPDTLDIDKTIFEINERENRTNLEQLLERISPSVTAIPKPLFVIAVSFLVMAIIFYYLSRMNPRNIISDDTELCLDNLLQVKSKNSLEGHVSTKSNLLYFQKIVDEVKKSGNEDAEKYLTNDFLQVMSNYTYKLNDAEENDYSRYLTPEDLLQMGKYYYRCQSQHLRDNEAGG